MLNKKKQILFEKQAQIVTAMAHPLRIAILDFLKNGEQCVCKIAKHKHWNASFFIFLCFFSGALV